MLLEFAPFCIGVVIIAMLARSAQRKGRDSQGKFLGLLIVILALGILIIYSAYNGILTRHLNYYVGSDNELPRTQDTYLTPPKEVEHSEKSSLISKENEQIPIIANEQEKKIVNAEEKVTDIYYGIMFDAGSTGSRIHVFKFQKMGEGKPDKFLTELYQFNKEGLSSFAENPSKGADSLKSMMEAAKGFIPEDQWASTPIALKATAGLRLLPADKATALLDEVKKLFNRYPFKQKPGNVAIMGGNDEGIFSWFTVNFLNGVLGDITKMIGVMDLGGGSTQITFTPRQQETINAAPKGYLIKEEVFGQTFQVYTHSYLGSGLMAGRLASLGETDLDHESENEDEPKKINSPCLAEGVMDSMKYGSKQYNIQGKACTNCSRFDDCYSLTKKAVQTANISRIDEIKTKKFYAISYFFDKAEDARLIGKVDGGEVKIQDFFLAANKECSLTKKDTQKPLLCLDLCYICALLHNGYGFEQDTSVTIKKKIDGTEISWALGAIFDLYNQQTPHDHGR